MPHLYRLSLTFLFLSLSVIPLHGQTFTASPTFHELIYDQDQFVFYAYSTLTNLTATDLNMGWRKSFPRPYPADWDNTVEVPDTFYTQREMSGTFLLEANPVIPEKLICQFYPNNTLAAADVIIRVFNLADTTEYVDVEWSARTTPSTTSVEPDLIAKPLRFMPNPSREATWLEVPLTHIGGQLIIRDIQGKSVIQASLVQAGPMQLSTRDWPAGLYWVWLADANGAHRQFGKLSVIK